MTRSILPVNYSIPMNPSSPKTVKYRVMFRFLGSPSPLTIALRVVGTLTVYDNESFAGLGLVSRQWMGLGPRIKKNSDCPPYRPRSIKNQSKKVLYLKFKLMNNNLGGNQLVPS